MFFFILTLVIFTRSFAQQEDLYYKIGMEVFLDSLIMENPKVKFFLTNEYTSFNTHDDPFGGSNCSINFDDLKQRNSDSTKVVIPFKYKNRLKKKNFFNRLIYGDKLVELHIENLYKDSDTILFIARVYEKEGGIFIFIQFKINSTEVVEFCKGYFIY